MELATLFDVSKEAAARAYIDYTRDAIAVVVVRGGKVLRFHRNGRNFPRIAALGQ